MRPRGDSMTCPACGSTRPDDQLVLFGLCDPCQQEVAADLEGQPDYRDADFDAWVDTLAKNGREA